MIRIAEQIGPYRPLTRERWATFQEDRARCAEERSGVARRSSWLLILFITLLGYSAMGKGWAYVGIPPVLFVGEIALLLGIVTVMLRGRFDGVLWDPTLLAGIGLGFWCALRTFPYLSVHGTEALRDAALWGYGAFAFIMYGYIRAEPARLQLTIHYFYRYCFVFLPAVPFIWVTTRYFSEHVPSWPWAAEVPVVDAKGGDVMVHLAGILAFWVSGLGRPPSAWRIVILTGSVAAVGSYNRGGLLAALMVFAFCMALRPGQHTLWRLILTGLVGLMVLAATDVRVTIPGKGRELSFNQVLMNMGSVIGDEDAGALSGTKEWRLKWWGQIVDYTVAGPYFWGGKGFGINLADDDGFQGTRWEGRLRSPHNGHLTYLARSGVPGFALWILIQLAWVSSVFHAYRQSTSRGQRRWSGLFLFLMAYWLAFTVNATFDVFLEGPMGGIWYWVVIGLGVAASRIYRTNPEVLPDHAAELA